MNVCVLWAQSGFIPQDHAEDVEQQIYPTPFHSEVAEWHVNAQLTISGMPSLKHAS